MNPGMMITLGTAFINSVAVLINCRLARTDNPFRLGSLRILFAMLISGIPA
jgi:hypothetical protein